jgi:hypothetical protein
LIAVASFLFSLWASFVGFHHSIFDFHGFRQTQTAISAEYMEHGGAFFRYQTPIVGSPWCLPFEFPLYQKIVALISEHLHVPLEEAGRAVSIAFFYLCFLPLASILKRFHYNAVQILAVLSLLALSPLYIFVSRMFMMESLALFLSIMYVDHVVLSITAGSPWRFRYMVSAGVFGALAGMVKITTFTPYLLLACCLLTWHGWKLHKRGRLTATSAVVVTLLCGLIPMLCTVLWTRFADAQKAKNPIGMLLISKNLSRWNFGSLAQRLNPANYAVFSHRVAAQAGSLPLLLLIVLIYVAVVRRWNAAALVSLALYIITPMIFFNLHLVHEYYPYSSAIFLIVGAGLLIADLLNLAGHRAWLGFACFIALAAACFLRYHTGFYRLQRWNAPGRAEAATVIDRTTNPGDVIVITGLGLSSELPYQSHRRAIMDPGPGYLPTVLGPVGEAIQEQQADTIPELVICDDARESARAQVFLQFLALQPSTALHADNCDIYLRSAQ